LSGHIVIFNLPPEISPGDTAIFPASICPICSLNQLPSAPIKCPRSPLRFPSVLLTLEPPGCSESCRPRRHCRRQTSAILVSTDRLGFLFLHHLFYFVQEHLPDMMILLLTFQNDVFIHYWISPSTTSNSGERLPRNQTTSTFPTSPSNLPHHSKPSGKALAHGFLCISHSCRHPKLHCHIY
jgi:hypothetical protein